MKGLPASKEEARDRRTDQELDKHTSTQDMDVKMVKAETVASPPGLRTHSSDGRTKTMVCGEGSGAWLGEEHQLTSLSERWAVL